MKVQTVKWSLLASCVIYSLSCTSQSNNLQYPETPKEASSISYHGSTIVEDYTWLNNAADDKVKTWVKSQDEVMRGYVRSMPQYSELKAKVGNLMSISGRAELPMMGGDKTFFLRDDAAGKWNFLIKEGSEERGAFQPEPPFNPRAFYFYIPSPDGRYVAMAMATGHFDWKILDVTSGKLLDETLLGRDLGGTRLAWSRDSKSFYYIGPGTTDSEGARSEYVVKKHVVGTVATSDKAVFTPKSDGSKLELNVCKGGDYLIIAEREGAATQAKVSYMITATDEVKTLIGVAEASFIFLGNDGKNFYFETDHGAPGGRVVSINIDNPTPTRWRELIPEGEKPVMGYQSAGGTFLPLMVDNKFVIPYQKDLKQYLGVYDLTGKPLKEIQLPSGGLYFNTNGLNALSGIRTGTKLLTRFIGITEPSTILEVDIRSGKVVPFSRAKTNFSASDYTSEIIFSTSKDGTQVPISLTYKKGLKRDGRTPLLMQVYGAIAFTNYPYFQGDYMTWLEMGGIHGVAHIRGGGALGSKWHQQGIARNKQNGIDDYISAIEKVVDARYTSYDKIVINGVSAGTIPVGGVLTQRPEIVGAAVLHYGMLDMIGYADKFSSDTNHGYMIPEIGSASNREDFEALASYSPYQKIAESVNYPPVLALTSEVDTPLDTDSYRFIAKLQNIDSSNPYLLQMAWASGHSGFGSQTHSPVDTFADEIAFLIKAMRLDTKDLFD